MADGRDLEVLRALAEMLGHDPADGPANPPRIHPDQWEAEQRQAEKAELDRDFRRVYGDGR